MSLFLRPNVLQSACLTIGLILAVPAFGQQALYHTTGEVVVTPSIAAVASADIELDLTVFEQRGVTLQMSLPDGPIVDVAEVSREERHLGLVWRGEIVGDHHSHVGITVHRGQMSGRIFGTDGLWEISPQPGGRHSIDKLEDQLFPACAVDHDHSQHNAFAGGDPNPCPSPSDPIDRVDLLLLYTPTAMNAAGGQAQIEAVGQSAVDRMNESLMNAQMPARVRLAHIEMANYDDSGSISSDLGWLSSNSGVADLRNQYRTDMVGMLNNGGGACGIGQLPRNWGAGGSPNSVHQVTARSCAVGNLSFAHEHGHNIGFEHDPANGGSPGSGTFPFRYGHYVSGSYRSVMSYSNQCTGGCPRAPYFSNSNVSFMGAPTGVLDQRENYRVGNRTLQCVTDYRLNAETIYADGLETLPPN